MGPPVQFVPLIFENGHVFVPAKARGLGFDWNVCSLCGVVRRRDGQNKRCQGRVQVTLRNDKDL